MQDKNQINHVQYKRAHTQDINDVHPAQDASAQPQEANRGSWINDDRVQVMEKGIAPEERSILATVPSRPSSELNATKDLHPETYRQALKVILATPEIEGRLHYITATVIVSIFGGWLAGRAVASRTFALIIDTALLFIGAAIAGALIGVLLGENFLPGQTIPIVLFALTGGILLLLGILIGAMAPSRSADDLPESWASHRITVAARERRSLPQRRK